MPPQHGSTPDTIEESRFFTPRFDAQGLIPAIAVEAATGELLMMAWMNREALALTLSTGEAHYFSRSRQAIWKKGATSGATQRVVEILVDCDQDALVVRAEVAARAGTCHTGRATCFYRRVPLGKGPIERAFASEPAT